MERGSTFILKMAIVLIGLIVLGLCLLVLPAGLLSDNTGYYRPILLGLYIPAIPFFFALYSALSLLNLIEKNEAFSIESVNDLKKIKYSAVTICALFAAGMPYIFYAADRDDAPGVALIGFVIIGSSFVIATAAAVFQSLLQNAVDIKSENDLTV
jgi:hypothetical protein